MLGHYTTGPGLHSIFLWILGVILRQQYDTLLLVGVPGLEPGLTEPESGGLPITPYPTAVPRGATRTKFTRLTQLYANQKQKPSCRTSLTATRRPARTPRPDLAVFIRRSALSSEKYTPYYGVHKRIQLVKSPASCLTQVAWRDPHDAQLRGFRVSGVLTATFTCRPINQASRATTA